MKYNFKIGDIIKYRGIEYKVTKEPYKEKEGKGLGCEWMINVIDTEYKQKRTLFCYSIKK